jgi:glutamate formiminotransferase
MTHGTLLMECVVNVSEGRRSGVIEAIRTAAQEQQCASHRARSGRGCAAAVLDVHSDPDHNRSVLTLAGAPGPLVDAVVGLSRRAVELIDLRSHSGAHPRLGAVDVVPFVPLRAATMEDAAAAAEGYAQRLWEELGVPSFLYEAAARSSRSHHSGVGVSLPAVRAAAFGSIQPDVGGPAPHPTAGTAVVGARPLLVAYNVNLRSPDPAVARRIAARVRERDGGLPHIRAMGLFLPTAGVAQVSMNLVRPATTTIADAFDAVTEAARSEGTAVLTTELVGLAPRAALGGRDPAGLGLASHPRFLEEEIEHAFGTPPA